MPFQAGDRKNYLHGLDLDIYDQDGARTPGESKKREKKGLYDDLKQWSKLFKKIQYPIMTFQKIIANSESKILNCESFNACNLKPGERHL